MKDCGDDYGSDGNDRNGSNAAVILKVNIFFKQSSKFQMTVKSHLSRVSRVYNLRSCKASTARSSESKNTVCMQFL